MGANDNQLNEFQQRRLNVTCRYIDKLLSDVEAVLWAAASKSAFPKYISDIPPLQRRVIEDYIARIRARLIRTLESQGIAVEPPAIPATRSVHTALTFVEIAVEELRPSYMRGYGQVSPEATVELDGIVAELQGLVSDLGRFVAGGGTRGLRERVDSLSDSGMDVSMLRKLERIITQRGLVEFRSTVNMILERLEENAFEVAIFGRVSSGKSSLLNEILGMNVLPVGVTPITAVPTRLTYGESAIVKVSYADGHPSETMQVERLPEIVAEQENPGNRKHVSRVLVQVPSLALRDGVVLVDTPGLGSLATSGAEETLAYLPRCDLGVVLIDAVSALNFEDLHTIQALYQARIPSQVLISKADLLSEKDRNRVVDYVREHIRSEVGLELDVHPVSIIAGYQQMLRRWLQEDIVPLFERRDQLRPKSVQRKIATLRDSVGAALRSRVRRADHRAPAPDVNASEVDALLRSAGAHIEQARREAERITETLAHSSQSAIQASAVALVKAWRSQQGETKAAQDGIVGDTLRDFTQRSAKELHDIVAELVRHVADVLEGTAKQLGLSDAAVRSEFDGVLREMPAFSPAAIRAVSRPALAAWLGVRGEKRAVERQLRSHIGEQLTDMLQTYSQLLFTWADKVTRQIDERFRGYADVYRAQLERIASNGSGPAEDIEGIEADLHDLGVPTDESRSVLAR